MKNPNLKFKYIKGVGDLIACFLHSKPIGWFTHLITGKKEPCMSCSKRITALNILLPIEIWKFFFNDFDEYKASIVNEFALYQKHLEFLEENKKNNPIIIKENKQKLISTNKINLDNYLIKIEIYKI